MGRISTPIELGKIRRDNLNSLLKNYGSKRKFAQITGISPTQLSQFTSPESTRLIGDALARKIEDKAHIAHGSLDIKPEDMEGFNNQAELCAKAMNVMVEYCIKHELALERMAVPAREAAIKMIIIETLTRQHIDQGEIESSLSFA